MAQILFFIGIYWLGSALWIALGGAEEAVWAALIPAVYATALPFLVR